MTTKLTFGKRITILACAVALSACGGGGGSPGTVPGKPEASKAVSVMLATSADTIDASGLDGTEVTLTAIVKDANNNGLSGETVDFKADSGTVTSANRVTDATGTVTAKLSVKGDASARVITISANVGTLASAPKKVSVVAVPSSVQSVQLYANSDTLQPGAGAAVTVTARVLDTNNVAVANADVALATSSGELAYTVRRSDANGVVTAVLTSLDTTPRTITVTARTNASVPVTKTVNVVSGANVTQVTRVISSSDTLQAGLGASVTVTVRVLDANNNAVRDADVTLAASSGELDFAVRKTDAAGTVTAVLSSIDPTPRAITVTAKANASVAVVKTVNVVSVASVVPVVQLYTSSDTLQTSTGSTVTVTARVLDASNNAVQGIPVALTTNSGELVFVERRSDVNGLVTAVLSSLDPTPRAISVTASASGGAPVTKSINVASAVPRLLLTATSGQLASSGAPGSEVSIVALVLDANNAVVPNTQVAFKADSGALSGASVNTDAKGLASVTLGTGADPATRTINVTASAADAKPVTLQVAVQGNKLTISSSATVNLGAVTDMTVTLQDSAGAPLAGRDVSFSARVNPVTLQGGGASPGKTNSAGQIILRYTATSGAADTVTVRALGETASTVIAVNSSNFFVNVVDANDTLVALADINRCYAVAIHNDLAGVPQTGTVSVSTSRGTVYSDAACSVPLTSALTLTAGNARAYLSATGPGVATVTVSASAGNATAQGGTEFVAPLLAGAVISVQADPAVVGANTPGSTSQQSTLRAVVRDAASQGNLVKNAKVVFSIISDPSGGTLTQPAELLTSADGSASVNYIAGTSSTADDGVVIQARIQSAVSLASSTVKLTVAKKALFISAGTGSAVLSPNSTTYQIDYVVFVTDVAGNAVSGVNVTGKVRPRQFYKGTMSYFGLTGPWAPAIVDANGNLVSGYMATCQNEDTDRDGGYTAAEDMNGNGRLDPGIPVTITSSGKTDAAGTAIVSLLYPRDRAYWLDVDFTIRGAVSNTEASYVGYALLPGAGKDYTDRNTAPPGVTSPYGKSGRCTDAN